MSDGCVVCSLLGRTQDRVLHSGPGEPDVSLAMIYSLPEEAGWLVTG